MGGCFVCGKGGKTGAFDEEEWMRDEKRKRRRQKQLNKSSLNLLLKKSAKTATCSKTPPPIIKNLSSHQATRSDRQGNGSSFPRLKNTTSSIERGYIAHTLPMVPYKKVLPATWPSSRATCPEWTEQGGRELVCKCNRGQGVARLFRIFWFVGTLLFPSLAAAI